MYFRIPSLRLRVHLLALPTLFALYWVEGVLPATTLLFSGLLHETGHLLALRFLKVPVRRIDAEPMGVTICYRETDCALRASALIAFAGPGCNLLCGLLFAAFLPLVPNDFEMEVAFFTFCNLFLAFLNLLPLERLDGGAILHALLSLRFSAGTAYRVSHAVSVCFTLLLTLTIILLGVALRFPLWTVLLSAVFLSRM